MAKSADSLYQLIEQADQLPYGDGKDALLEEVLRHAEAGEHTEVAFYARLRLIDAYTQGMQPAKLFVPFARCLADYDRNPAAHEPWVAATLRWDFKHAITAMTKFPEVPKDRALAVLDQMERRYRTEGQSLHAVYAYRYRVAAHIGDRAAADEWYAKWCTTPRDENSDCAGCDPTNKADYLVDRGRDAEAIAVAGPVLDGELDCEQQPQRILTTLLLPYVRTGQLEQARNAHRRAYRILRTRPQDVAEIGDHLQFCALSGNQSRGLELLDRHLGWLDRAPSPKDAMWFAASAALLLRTVVDAGHGAAIVRRPAHADRPAAELNARTLHDELARHAFDIAARFDQRNGTDHQTSTVRSLLASEPLVEQLPLSAAADHRVPAPRPQVAAAVDVAALTANELVERAEHLLRRYADEAAEPLVRQLISLSEDAPADSLLAARTAVLRARLASWDDHDAATESLLWQAVERYEAAGDENGRQVALGCLGKYLCAHDRVEEGSALLRASHAYLIQRPELEGQVWSAIRLASGLLQAEDSPAEHLAEVESLLAQAAATAAESGDPVLIGDVAAHRMHRHIHSAEDLDAAIDAARTAVAAFKEAGIPRMVAPSAFRLGVLLRSRDEAEAALVAADEALAALAADAPADLRVVTHGLRGAVLNDLDRPGEAINDLLTAVAIGRAEGLPQVARCVWDLAIAYRATGQLLDAADLAEEAVASWEGLGQHDSAHQCRYLLAGLHLQLGEPDQALALYEEIVEFHRARDEHGAVAEILAETADLLDTLDRDALAAEHYRQAADAALLDHDPLRVAYCRYCAALSLHWSGETAEALAALEVADQAFRDFADAEPDPSLLTWHRARLDYNAARILFADDRLADAASRAVAAATGFRAIDAIEPALRADLVYGRVLLEMGRADEAAAVLGKALTEVEEDDPLHEVLSSALAAAREHSE
ncbi:hypothetical protein [Nocardia sp. NPDC052316]|uniref:hypothetical protein n=1 Tax=Nocardia sp. NPDC052316 TaxID=3364329 RepID=UPI0037CC44F1